MDLPKFPKFAVCVLGAILIIEIAIFYYIFFNVKANIDMQNPEPIVKDEPADNILQEIEAPCPICGEMSWGINGSIVCTTKGCPNYGLAVPVGD